MVKSLREKWTKFRMPTQMSGKTFCEIGCWDGSLCIEALRLGAKQAVAIDMCVCDELKKNIKIHGFDFIQMDVFSEKFLQVGQFDVVSCNGVLYHVENPMSLLSRLRNITKELLVLETRFTKIAEKHPVMVFLDENSSWWAPNKECLVKMLRETGFSKVTQRYEGNVKGNFGRVCYHAVPNSSRTYKKLAPRTHSFMEINNPEPKG